MGTCAPKYMLYLIVYLSLLSKWGELRGPVCGLLREDCEDGSAGFEH